MRKLKIILQSNWLYIFLIFITLLYCLIIIKGNIYHTNYSEDSNSFIGVITDIKYKDNYNIIEVKNREKIIAYDYFKSNYKIGYKIKIKGNFSIPKENSNFYLFNYRNYLKSKKIYFQVNVNQIEILNKDLTISYKVKNWFIKRIEKINNPYLNAFILGDSSKIKNSVINSYNSNGISHLFAISGMHVGLITIIITFILNKFLKKSYNYFIIFFILLFYIFLTNGSKSVIRASMFYFLLSINKIFKLNISTIKLFVILLLITLILNPYTIYSNSFLFSYSITLFIILFSQIINNFKNYFAKVFATSLISFLASIPILINSYFNINLLSPFLNIIFVPLISFIIFPLSIITFLMPIFNNLLNVFISCLEFLSLFFQKQKYLSFNMCHINLFFIFIYYVVIIFTLYKISYKKYYSLIIIILILFIHTNYRYFDNTTSVIMLDVNQGDSILILLAHNKGNILIDTGGRYNQNLTERILIPTLKSNGVKKLDYLILSHGDYDHMGESVNLINNFKVNNVILNCGEFNNLEKNLINLLNKKKIPYYSCIKKLNIEDNNLYFLNNKRYNNENDNSNVIYTNLNNYKFLFMGDSGIDVENYLLKKYNLKDIDIFKVGHHGSKTSSSKKFIDIINPKYAMISVGANNRYGHPNKETLRNLKYSQIFRTDLDGSIRFKIKNNKLFIKTCLS